MNICQRSWNQQDDSDILKRNLRVLSSASVIKLMVEEEKETQTKILIELQEPNVGLTKTDKL